METNQQDTRENKDEKTEVEESIVQKNVDRSVLNILDVLGAIANIQRSHTQVRVAFTTLGTSGYGPKEWVFSIADKVQSRYDVIHVGPERIPFVVRKPLIQGTFNTIDTFIVYALDAINQVMKTVYTLYKEPNTVNLNNELVAEPSQLGFPMDSLLESNIPAETVHNAVSPFCRAVRSPNANFSNLSIFEGLNFGELRSMALAIHRNVVRNLRDVVEEMFEHINDGVLSQKAPIPLNNSVMLNGVANPVNLNLMFRHIPRRVHLSSTFVSEMLMPELKLEAMSPSSLLSLGSQTATRISTVNALCNISFSPLMNDQIVMWVVSLLAPGSILFNINFDDIPSTDVYLRALAALAAKLLLSYSRDNRWNSITPRTLHAVEQAIVNAGTEAGVLESINNPGENPLDRVAGVPQSGLARLDLLQTNDNGHGWRDDGFMRFSPLPVAVPYVHCQRRQLVATHLEHSRAIETGESSEAFNDWRTRAGIYDFLSALNRGRIQRTPMTGINAIMQTLSRRLIEFYISFNE